MDRVTEMQKTIGSDSVEELVGERIGYDVEFYGGRLPREVVVSWNGYIQSLAEWSPAATAEMTVRLRALLPAITDDPRSDDRVEYPRDALAIEARRNVRTEFVESRVGARIAADRERFGRELPRETAISWSGYIQALGEWCPDAGDIIAPLRSMLPAISNDPSSADNGQYLEG